jgi:hypothetical protein
MALIPETPKALSGTQKPFKDRTKCEPEARGPILHRPAMLHRAGRRCLCLLANLTCSHPGNAEGVIRDPAFYIKLLGPG